MYNMIAALEYMFFFLEVVLCWAAEATTKLIQEQS